MRPNVRQFCVCWPIKREQTLGLDLPTPPVCRLHIDPLFGLAVKPTIENETAWEDESVRLDGIFVLRTNTDIAPLDAMLCYKQLTMVEQAFRNRGFEGLVGSSTAAPG
jgi:hypothetical protein